MEEREKEKRKRRKKEKKVRREQSGKVGKKMKGKRTKESDTRSVKTSLVCSFAITSVRGLGGWFQRGSSWFGHRARLGKSGSPSPLTGLLHFVTRLLYRALPTKATHSALRSLINCASLLCLGCADHVLYASVSLRPLFRIAPTSAPAPNGRSMVTATRHHRRVPLSSFSVKQQKKTPAASVVACHCLAKTDV